jgi:hypothetical protein
LGEAFDRHKEVTMNPIIIEYILREHRLEVQREAERLRLLASADTGRSFLRRRSLMAAGDLLIRLGAGIKCRYGHRQPVLAGAAAGNRNHFLCDLNSAEE